MKIRSKINQFFSLFWVVLIVCLTGCVNLIDEPEVNSFSTESSVMVTGSFDLDLEGAFPKEILSIVNNSKNAVPNVPTLYYQIQAERTSVSPSQWLYFKCGTNQNFVIYLPHTAGTTDTWVLKAQAFIEDTEFSSNTERYIPQNIAFEGIYSPVAGQNYIEIGEEQPSFYINSPIKLNPVNYNRINDEDVGGRINLPVYWESQIGLTKIQYQIDDGTPQIITVDSAHIPANINPSDKYSKGGHNLKMDFFAGDEIIYSLTEKIFSFVNLTTDTWVINHYYLSNQVEYFELQSDGSYKLKITRDCVNHYRQNTFYVSDSGTSPDDGGRGTYYKPFRTLTQALTEIHKRPANGDYTIYIVPVSGSFNNPSDVDTAYIEDGNLTSTGLRRVSIVGYGDQPVAVVCSSANTCFLKVPEGLNDYFILENLAFYSWSTQIIDTTKGVAAVNCYFSGTFSSLGSPYFNLISGTSSSTYLNNCTFESFKWMGTGTNSPLYMEGTAYIENCIFKSNKTAYGGAIYCNNLTLEIKDSTFSDNTATSDGGAIYITGASNVTIGGNTVFEINKAEGITSSGGAINISSNSSSTLLIKDNVRFGDASEAAKANVAKCGSAICITGASVSVTIQDKVSIEGNIAYSDNVNGSGAICVCQGATLTIGKEGAPNTLSPKIYKNTTFKFGTINIAGGTLNFNSGVISENVAADLTDLTAPPGVKTPLAGAIFSNSSLNTININGGQIINNKCNNSTNVQQPRPGGIFTYSMNIKGPAEIYGNKYVKSDNTEQKLDIFLCTDSSASSKYINIAGALTSSVDENKLINVTLSNATNYEYSDDASSDKKIIGKQTGATYNNEVFTSAAEHFENAEEYAVEYYLNTGTDCINYNKTTDVSVEYNALPSNIVIKSKEQFNKIFDFINDGNNFAGKTITLYKDIDMEDGFEGASPDKDFQGTFDGNGKSLKLSNVTENIYFMEDHKHSIFGKVSKSGDNVGTIKNLTVEGNITVNSDDGLYLFCSELNGGLIENCTNKCKINNTNIGNGNDDITGIVGTVSSGGTVKGCINEGNFEGGQMAGICHELTNGNIVNCGNKGNLNSQRYTYTGGVVRTVSGNGGYIVNCYNEGAITGDQKCGGLVGECFVENTYIINCYNGGSIIFSGREAIDVCKIGGLVGEVHPQMTIMNCYSSTQAEDNIPLIPCVGDLDSNKNFTGTLKYVEGGTVHPFSSNTTIPTGYSSSGISGWDWYNENLSECSTELELPSGITLKTWINDSGFPKFDF